MQLSVATILQDSAVRFPDRTALVEGGVRTSYRALWLEVLGFAAELRDRGVGPGDKVAVMLPNTADFPRAYYAVLAVGATVVPVHGLLIAQEAAYVLRHSGCTAVVGGGPLRPVAAEAAA
ncbi:AMP-binding protein, partial [Streptomyces sp. T-3]|nr:AMP-binding protein [Streptomyces sp. T-3]